MRMDGGSDANIQSLKACWLTSGGAAACRAYCKQGSSITQRVSFGI
jgi:hypothetical protein